MDRQPVPKNLRDFLRARPAERSLWESLCATGSAATGEKYLQSLDREGLENFFFDLSRADMSWLRAHRRALLFGFERASGREYVPVETSERLAGGGETARRGRAAIAAGEVAVAVFAGGAASRFFHSGNAAAGPAQGVKGLCPATPVANFSFLERLAFELLQEGICAGRLLPWVIMTSPATGEAIRAWLDRSALRQYPKESIILLEQSTNPRLDMDGDLVAGADGRLLWTGNGHGGIFSALLRTDADGSRPVERLRSLGVRHLVMHNVDNLCARPLWPARLGYHLLGGYDMTLSAVARVRPEEKLGIFARRRQNRIMEVLEYSECPPAVASALGPDGSLAFRWGHINTNIVRLESARADVPPTLYRNRRADAGGRVIDTSTFEMLNQSLTGLLHPDRVGIAEVGRELFQPVKSRGGEDSLEEAQSRLSLAHARRLAENGAAIEPGTLVELDPALGLEDDGASRDSNPRKVGRGWKIEKDSRIYLGVRHSMEGRMPYGPGLSVGQGATFWVEAASPYGSIRLGADNGLSEDPASAGKIVLGRDVRVEAGASVRIRIQGDGLVMIPDGATLSGCIDEVVPPGSVVVLTKS